jgi:CubicO group peptidase (beta-lactamase class C family)
MADWQTPGLAIAVVKDGKIVFAKGYGVRRLGGTDAVGPDSVFAAASITKGFTAAALAMLVAEDKLRWDDRVIDHLPDFRLQDPFVTREIRIRDLLSHRSGVARGEMLWYYSGFNRRDVLQRLRHLQQRAGFRSKFGYQNLMFVAAGEVVAAVSGMPWDDFIRQRIFKPLGMAASSTSVRGLSGDVAAPHARIDGKYQPIDWLNADNIGPAGSINASVRDLAQWMRLQLGDGRIAGQQVLTAGLIAEMRKPHTPIPLSTRNRTVNPHTNFRAYGLGWFLQDYRGQLLAYHGGRLDGMSAYLALAPNAKLGVAILSNRGRSNLPRALAYRVIDAFLGAPERDWSTEYRTLSDNRQRARETARERARRARMDDTRPSQPLANFAGRYTHPVFGGLTLLRSNTGLILSRNDAAIADLEHWHYDTFKARFRSPALRDRTITFRFDADGAVASLELGRTGRFLAVDAPIPPALRKGLEPGAGKAGWAGSVGVWSGEWDGVQPHTLVIEKADNNRINALYAWGLAPAWGIRRRGWKILEGAVSDNILTLRLSAQIHATYRLDGKGGLEARYIDGNRIRRATLRRLPK